MNEVHTKTRGLLFSTVYYPFASGAEIAIKEITDRLPEYSWDLVTARCDKKLPLREEVGRVVIHRVGFGWKTADKFLLPITGLWKALQIKRQKNFRVVWSMMASQASVAAAFLKMRHRSVRLVLTLQEGDEEEHLMRYVGGNEFLYKLLIRPWHTLVFKKADVITVLSEHLKQRALRHAPKTKIVVVPNGVDFSIFEKVSPPTSGPTILVTTSRLVTKNDVESVIRALPLLSSAVHFWIIGQGELEPGLKGLVRELQLEDRVFFLGHMDHVRVAETFSKAHIFVRPSLSEGLGSSFLEAMAAGLPVIATPVGGIPDFLKDGETGLFCEVKNPHSIARAVQRLIDDPALYSKIREGAYSLVHTQYTWSGVAEAMHANAFGDHKMRVVIAAAIYPPDAGGPATHARHAVEELPMHGMVTELTSFRDVRNYPWGVRHVLYFLHLLKAARQAEIIYAYDAVSVGVAAALVASLLRIKFVLRIGGDRLWEYAFEKGKTDKPLSVFYTQEAHRRMLLFKIIRRVVGRADALVVPSETTAALYEKEYDVPKDRISIIPNPVSGERRSGGTLVLPPTILFVSRLVRYKNLAFVIDALAELKRESVAFRFLICGDGPLRESLVRLIEERDLGDRVKLMGYVEKAQLEKLYSESALTLAPALTEFHPNYVLDGIVYGKPFLISRGHAFPFAVPEMYMFDPENSQDFQEKLGVLLSPQGYENAKVALKEIAFSYTWAENSSDTARLLKKVCES